MASGHRLGVLEFSGAEDASNTITQGAEIEAICDNNWSATENGTELRFSITDGNAASSEVLRLAPGSITTYQPITFSGADAVNQIVLRIHPNQLVFFKLHLLNLLEVVEIQIFLNLLTVQ